MPFRCRSGSLPRLTRSVAPHGDGGAPAPAAAAVNAMAHRIAELLPDEVRADRETLGRALLTLAFGLDREPMQNRCKRIHARVMVR